MAGLQHTSKKSVWGPALWLYLHTAAEYCDNPEAFSGLVMSLVGTLPCPECRKHLKDYTTRLSPVTAIKDVATAVQYIRDLHNHVNTLTGKEAKTTATTVPSQQLSVPAAPAPRQRGSGLLSSTASARPTTWYSPPRYGPRAPRTVTVSRTVAAPRLRRH